MHTTTVYLICFQPGILRGARPGNASHYLGSASYPTPPTVYTSTSPAPAGPLVKAAHDRGLNPMIVATWPGSKQTERAMKRHHRLAHYCPRCVT